jgi:hypothetical protein
MRRATQLRRTEVPYPDPLPTQGEGIGAEGEEIKNLTPDPLPLKRRSTLTPGADAVPSPAKKRARVIRYSGDMEGNREIFPPL